MRAPIPEVPGALSLELSGIEHTGMEPEVCVSSSPTWGDLTTCSPSCRYPHDVVNHLSCDEARNHYGGVVSLIPIVLDLMKEWIAHSEKLPRKVLQHVSEVLGSQGAAAATTRPAQTTFTQHWLGRHKYRQLAKESLRSRGKDKGFPKPPWRPPGGKL